MPQLDVRHGHEVRVNGLPAGVGVDNVHLQGGGRGAVKGSSTRKWRCRQVCTTSWPPSSPDLSFVLTALLRWCRLRARVRSAPAAAHVADPAVGGAGEPEPCGVGRGGATGVGRQGLDAWLAAGERRTAPGCEDSAAASQASSRSVLPDPGRTIHARDDKVRGVGRPRKLDREALPAAVLHGLLKGVHRGLQCKGSRAGQHGAATVTPHPSTTHYSCVPVTQSSPPPPPPA